MNSSYFFSVTIAASLPFLFLTHRHTIIMMTINAISSRSPPPDAPAITPIKASLDRADGDSVVAERREEIH